MINIFGVIGTLFFGILSVILFLRSQRVKKPMIFYKYMLLHAKKHPDVKILYHGNDLEYLSRALIFICNKGKKEIRRTDIPNTHMPLIQAGDNINILSASLISFSDESINMKIDHKNNKQVYIDFEYLNYNDGGIIEVLLDGNTKNIKKPLDFNATIIGAKKLKVKQFTSYNLSDVFSYIAWIFTMVCLLSYLFYKGIISIESDKINYLYFIGSVLVILFEFFIHRVSPFYIRVPKFAKKAME